MKSAASFVFLLLGMLAGNASAQQGAVADVDVAAYESWLEAYSRGEIALMRRGEMDLAAERRFREVFDKVAAGQDLLAARRLWQAANIFLPAELEDEVRAAAMLDMVHEHAKRLLAGLADPAVDAWLAEIALRKTGRDADHARLTAIEVLGLRERPETAKLLLDKLDAFPMPERIQAVLALERTASLEAIGELLPRLRQHEPNLRVALIQTITGILAPYSDETRDVNTVPTAEGAKWTPVVVEALRSTLLKEEVWQVRAATVDGLVRLKTRQSIPVLIEGLKRELARKNLSNFMVATGLHDALVQLTGQEISPGAPQLWEDFWKKEGATFRFMTREQKQGGSRSGDPYAKYFNLELKTKRVLFIIDFSGSMAEKVNLTGGRYAEGSRQIKYEIVKKELEKVVRALARDTVCNVIFFNEQVSVWRRDRAGRPAVVPMTNTNKSELLQFVWETTPSGSTNLYGALDLALAIGEKGVYDKYYGAAYDTVFLLSDGAPTAGKITDTDRIRAEVREANKLRRMKINTIVFGDALNNLKFMRALAEDSGGQFMHVQ